MTIRFIKASPAIPDDVITYLDAAVAALVDAGRWPDDPEAVARLVRGLYLAAAADFNIDIGLFMMGGVIAQAVTESEPERQFSAQQAAADKNVSKATIHKAVAAGDLDTVDGAKPLRIRVNAKYRRWKPEGAGRPAGGRRQVTNNH